MENIKKQLMKEHRQLRIRKFCKNRMAVIGMIITLFMTVLALFAPLIATHDPLEMVVIERLKAPSAQHLFGTDTFGRDLFSRVAYGARLSMGVGLSVGVLTMVAGMIIGLYACYYKALDNILMRICDGLKAIPSILLAITMMAVIGPSTKNVIISLTLVSIPGMARIARSNALSIKPVSYTHLDVYKRQAINR